MLNLGYSVLVFIAGNFAFAGGCVEWLILLVHISYLASISACLESGHQTWSLQVTSLCLLRQDRFYGRNRYSQVHTLLFDKPFKLLKLEKRNEEISCVFSQTLANFPRPAGAEGIIRGAQRKKEWYIRRP